MPGTQYCDEFREPTGVPGTDGINPLALQAPIVLSADVDDRCHDGGVALAGDGDVDPVRVEVHRHR